MTAIIGKELIILQLQGITQEMAVDDDQKNWNKENTPLNENKLTSWQVSQNIMREIRQEVTRQVLAELTINNSDESDESDGREVCTLKIMSGSKIQTFINHPFNLSKALISGNNFRNNEISIDESREELARIINQRERYVGNASSNDFCPTRCQISILYSDDRIMILKFNLQNFQSSISTFETFTTIEVFFQINARHSTLKFIGEESELFYSGEDWTFSEKINKSPRSVQPKWKKLQWCRRPKCNSNEFCENKGRIAISEDGNEKRNGEGMEEFITPPLYTIPGIELECKKERKECSPKTLSVKNHITEGRIIPRNIGSKRAFSEMKSTAEYRCELTQYL
ncbi:hypothetical protein X798_04111 [Onchocerca flexuosa]|uniref:Uncharacterized protein n=1 Tax=Onchocerca flexuosa TaxID=387005 RepID=A0A238BU53_9BILA|nr:hypothetical protein X798_04111 [Onchocerca flexuosa]